MTASCRPAERSPAIDRLEQVITQDIGGRGLAFDPADNLVTRCRGNLGRAARNLAADGTAAAIVTGFYIAHAERPSIETDGPCGAIALAWLLSKLKFRVTLVTDALGYKTIDAGLRTAFGAGSGVALEQVPFEKSGDNGSSEPATEVGANHRAAEYVERFFGAGAGDSLTHLISIERAGPSWAPLPDWTAGERSRFEALCPLDHQDQVHNFRGQVIAQHTAPAHRLFDFVRSNDLPIRTIGIGDGGNEIGMGSIPWQVIHANIPSGLGARIACRVATDWTIACGVSNWGAYALGAAVAYLRGRSDLLDEWTDEREREVLRSLVDAGAVDGVTGRPSMSVDGLAIEQHLSIWAQIREAVRDHDFAKD